MIFHNSDGTHISAEEFNEKLEEIFKEDKWIMDGNYQRSLKMRAKEADTIFLLDFPTKVCLEGAESRVGTKRDDLPWTEDTLDETFRQKILDFSKTNLPEIYEILENYKDEKKIIVFKSREEIDKFLKEIHMNY